MTTNAGSSRTSRGVRARRTGRKMWNSGSGDSDPWWLAFSAATAEVGGGGEFGGGDVAIPRSGDVCGAKKTVVERRDDSKQRDDSVEYDSEKLR